MKKTKIVCTIGPASIELGVIKELIEKGMDVARINFSHGDEKQHLQIINTIRKISKNTAIMLDTKGPEMRIFNIKEPVELGIGERFTITSDKKEKRFPCINYINFEKHVKHGSEIFFDDGLIKVKVIEKKDNLIICRVETDGVLKDGKRVSLPGVPLPFPKLSTKDKKDILFGVRHKLDFIAASFVRSREDVIAIKSIIKNSPIKIISKIESAEGVKNIDDIIEESHGIMVARGDLGVELPSQKVPIIQKMIIRKCNVAGKPVIVATQMLDSMERNPRPTRAETSDVANAILDGADSVMLSGETASGKYPVQSVEVMHKIALETEPIIEHKIDDILNSSSSTRNKEHMITESICKAIHKISEDIPINKIVISTKSGATARMIARFRPKQEIIVVTKNPATAKQLKLDWSVKPVLYTRHNDNTKHVMQSELSYLIRKGFVNPTDLILITASIRTLEKGATNLIEVHYAKDLLKFWNGS